MGDFNEKILSFTTTFIVIFILIVSFHNCTENLLETSSIPSQAKNPQLFTPLPGISGKNELKCTAIDSPSWKNCISKTHSNEIDTIEINGQIICNDAACALQVKNKKSFSIIGINNSQIYRSGGFDKPLFSTYQVENVYILNVDFTDINNKAYKAKSGDQEINQHCLNFLEQKCEPILSIQLSNQVEIRKSKFLNGKIFGITLVQNDKVFISESIIQNNWWFGIWGHSNRLLEFSNNQFLNNRSNAFLMSFEKSKQSLITHNHFSGNHHATAFHVCGLKQNEPCPGGQIDLIEQVNNVTISENIFINGKQSLEFPEDINYDWISAIEFEPHSKNISNVQIFNNTIYNNSGSEFYINLPEGDMSRDLISNFSFYNNEICNNRTQGRNYDPDNSRFIWSKHVRNFDNFNCNQKTLEEPRLEQTLISSPSLNPSPINNSNNLKPFISLTGLGCDKNECIWITGYNFTTRCTVDIYKSDWSQFITKVTDTYCSGTLVTLKIPDHILNSEISINVTVINEFGLWAEPQTVKIKP